MFRSLSTGAIGVKASLPEAIDMAARHGFQGVHLGIGEVVGLGVDTVKRLLAEKGIRASAFGLPVRPDGSEEEFQSGMATLKEQAPVAVELGCLRTSTWIKSFADDLDFDANYERHRTRLGEAAAVLADHGIRLGLEFLGPKTIRAGHPYEFIHTMGGMLALCDDIGTGNVGLLFDAWHWFTAHGTVEELATLTSANVVDVHINDAPAGVPIDEQVDNVRCMPGETGVIDIAAFLQALDRMGYDGAVMVEPFSQRVRDLPDEDALAETRASMDKVWALAGLA